MQKCHLKLLSSARSQQVDNSYLPAAEKSVGPVSYTHLDVYKRQILGRAEMFASKNKVLPSIIDGLGMGVGFTAAMLCMGIILSLIHI